ncbi:MAG TPA: DUF1801 domain-containing protein [Candidatus Limnocylindrales bacterium]|nr:DUF1801 domain-containing protein [Candidatus Limnocylindrales bacterium]
MLAPESFDEYLAGLRPEQRAELERLRAIVHEEAPEAVEVIAYLMPAFRIDGRYFLGFAATKKGFSFYPGRLPSDMVDGELAAYGTWKGTINYDADHPLPDDVVRRLVRARRARLG